MSNHCDHCASGCRGRAHPEPRHARRHGNLDGATWSDGGCPACAERKQIEWLLDDLADYADDHGQIGRRNILDGVRRQIQDGVHRNGGDA